ncbi:MAG: hypothetical protein FWG30_06580 [Eubacteriaceae bacterium]|jgi:hypothetical protein|nr:hypothetical protein [Eubacteriaceae bacterium]
MKQLNTILISIAKSFAYVLGGFLAILVYKAAAYYLVGISIRGKAFWPIVDSVLASIVTAAYLYAIVYMHRGQGRERTGIALLNPWLRHFILGIGTGAIMSTAAWSILVAINGFHVTIAPFSLSRYAGLCVYALTMCFASIWEETLFRGVAAFTGRKAGKISCAVIVSFAFSIYKMAEGVDFSSFTIFFRKFDILAAISYYFFSLICFELTWITGSIWSAAGFNGAFYTVSRVIYGISLEGSKMPGVLSSDPSGISALITGNELGMISSLTCAAIFMVGFIFLWILYRNPKRADEPLADWLMYGSWMPE